MTTYVYETIPAKEGDGVQYFEFKQSMKDATLTRHPETGQAIRRAILGGFGILKVGKFLPCEQLQLWLRAGRMLRLKAICESPTLRRQLRREQRP